MLLVDRAHFPRDKPCGGGVTIRAAALLPFELTPVVEHVIDGAIVRLRSGTDFTRNDTRPISYMTQRRFLDAFLVEKAQEAGVEFVNNERVRHVERLPDGEYTVHTADRTLRCRVVIGADGANGVVAGTLGFDLPTESAVALEANIAFHEGVPPWIERRVALSLAALPGGYGWIFPKGNHVNVGVGGWSHVAGPRLRSALNSLCHNYGFTPESMTDLRGHHLPMQRPGAPVTTGGAALVGDAAGLIDPLSGEGIHSAFLSGVAIAPAVDDYLTGIVPDLTGYELTVERELTPELVASRQLMEIFHAFPAPAVALMKYSDRFWNRLCRMLCEEVGYADLVRSRGPLGPAALRLLSTVARAFNDRRYPGR